MGFISSSGMGFVLREHKEIVTLRGGSLRILQQKVVQAKIDLLLERAPSTSPRIVNHHIYLRGCLSPSFLLDSTVSLGTLVGLSSELLSGRPPKNTLALLLSLVYVVKRSSNSVSLQKSKQNVDYYKNKIHKRQTIETYGAEYSEYLAMAIKTLNSSSGISPMNELLLESPYVRLISCRF